MKKMILIIAVLAGFVSCAFSAETEGKPLFEQQATEAVGHAVFQTIAHFYKTRSFNPGELVATKENPVHVAFSESESGSIMISATNNSVIVTGRATLNANVSMSLEDTNKATNKEEGKKPNHGAQIPAKLTIKSGNYDCKGIFKVDGKKVTLKSGEAKITGDEEPVKFSEGTQAVIDGKEFTCKNGKWEPSGATATSTPAP
jgi:hypothetical protein